MVDVPGIFDKDCCCEIELIVDAVIALIKERFNDEKERCERSKYLPKLPYENVYFGIPAVIPPLCAVGVRGDRQVIDPEDREPRIPPLGIGNVVCPALLRSTLTIRWWYYDPDVEDNHRMVMRMGDVIRRILVRNPQLVMMGEPFAMKAWPEEVDFGTEVVEAFGGSRVAYGTGSMTVTALCIERLVSYVE